MKGYDNMDLPVEQILARRISQNFSNCLKKSRYKRSTFPGNNSDLKRIEEDDRIIEYKYKNGKMTTSSIITEGFIQSCIEIFKCDKIDFIFGGEEELESLLYLIFYSASRLAFIHDLDAGRKGPKPRIRAKNKRDIMLQKSLCNLFSFSAEYCTKRQNLADLKISEMHFYEYVEREIRFFGQNFVPINAILNNDNFEDLFYISIPFNEIFRFFWAFIKDKFTLSFKHKIIKYLVTVPPGSKEKPIKFHEVSQRINDWLYEDVANIIIPDVISRLENNQIFSLGLIVKNLLDARSRLFKDYSNAQQDSIINAEIVKTSFINVEEFEEQFISEEEIRCGDLYSKINEVNKSGHDLRIDYRIENNKRAINFFAKNILQDIEALCESLTSIQKTFLNTVSIEMEETILNI